MSDNNQLKKPENVKDTIWRQHLNWMEVTGKQVNENLKKYRDQIAKYGKIKY